MTSTSSLLHASMEVPVGEDLEMASPYQGQVDDFDIDIDLMDDHASNMDSDMMGADEFPNTSQPSLFQNDVTYDADMVDEPSEGSMVDTENMADEDHDIDVQYEVTYEAEMVEGDHSQDQPVDFSLSIAPIEAIPTAEVQINEPQVPAPETATEVSEKVQEVQAVSPVVTSSENPQEEHISHETHHEKNTSVQDNQSGLDKIEPAQSHQSFDAGVDQVPTEAGEQTNQTTVVEPVEPNEPVEHSISDDHPVPNPLADDSGASKAYLPETDAVIAAQHETHVSENGPVTFDEEVLHPIKVIYEDSEISLFPPLEGDSAETFFLHDESLAYEGVGKLFSSLREVLLDNVTEDDVLVLDIDCLGIQITEDSLHTSKVTLHQILEIYLRLCHNDGNHEPDDFYLSLSSRPSLPNELASLDAGSKEGKGLSQVQLWADYSQADVAAEETAAAGEKSAAESHVQDAEQDQSADAQGLSGDQVTSKVQYSTELNEVTATVIEGDNDTTVQHDVEPDFEFLPEQAKEEVDENPQGVLNDNEGAADVQDDFETARTETTNTVEADSEAVITSALSEDASAGATCDPNSGHHSDHDDQQLGNGELDEEIDEGDHIEIHDTSVPEENHKDHEDDHKSHDGNSAIPGAGVASKEQKQQEQDDANPTDAQEPDFDLNTTIIGKETPLEPEDDLLGIAEDVLQSPSKDGQNKNLANAENVDSENPDEEPTGAFLEDDFDDQQSTEDELDYDPELDVAEGLELGEIDTSVTDSHTHDTLSTKRSREEEDEWDITEATTPELKRQRPS
ncbi:uncharacterized protein N7483_006620 [Penicillium malachiteum]|uniref:uncharacterized protein n=1 Tax=Penicillium malachiteum TaxID=1324776 RepID=UPI002549A09B|nr:uncharacterized protein N7483_006620 [Penicillium malachiteum]KAJ5725263.1 hypothetical protein N7483_006620 [Penicillium malachiteum]